MKKQSVLTKFSQASIKKANSAMISRNAESGTWKTSGEIVLKAGDRSKTISTRISSEKINEAWARVIENEKV